MFPIRHTASLAAIVLGAATLAFSQEGQIQRIEPVVTQVGSGMARDPGLIEIQGKYLGLITEVRLDGAVLPVVRNNSYSLWLRPGPQEPGFGALELFYPRGVITETIAFTPTLVANHRPRTIELTIDHGEPGGWYVLNWSFRARSTPLIRAGIYYMDWLDMSTTFSGIVGSEFFDDSTAFEVFTHERMGIVSRPVFFQALCTTAGGEMCYSNPVVVYHGTHAPSDGPQVQM